MTSSGNGARAAAEIGEAAFALRCGFYGRVCEWRHQPDQSQVPLRYNPLLRNISGLVSVPLTRERVPHVVSQANLESLSLERFVLLSPSGFVQSKLLHSSLYIYRQFECNSFTFFPDYYYALKS